MQNVSNWLPFHIPHCHSGAVAEYHGMIVLIRRLSGNLDFSRHGTKSADFEPFRRSLSWRAMSVTAVSITISAMNLQ
jgi:hypothetical protein